MDGSLLLYNIDGVSARTFIVDHLVRMTVPFGFAMDVTLLCGSVTFFFVAPSDRTRLLCEQHAPPLLSNISITSQ
jgi:hypothetical protein